MKPCPLCPFTLADGRLVTDEETAEEALTTPSGPIDGRAPLVMGRVKVAQVVEPDVQGG